jgi:hypothetical protein
VSFPAELSEWVMSSTDKKEFVFILGAGISKPAGIPLMDEFLRKSWEYHDGPDLGTGLGGHPGEIDRFTHVRTHWLQSVAGDYNVEGYFLSVQAQLKSHPRPPRQLRLLWSNLLYVLIRTIHLAEDHGRNLCIGPKREIPQDLYRHFLDTIFHSVGPQKVAFVSFNYDLLIDQALMQMNCYPQYHLEKISNIHDPPNGDKVVLLKPHGSANWFVCDSERCQTVSVHWEKGPGNYATGGMSDQKGHGSDKGLNFLLVPPSDKEGQPTLLQPVWNEAKEVLREVKKIFFLGYSFPETDKHLVKFLKESWEKSPPQKVVVVNPGNIKGRYEQVFDEIFGGSIDVAWVVDTPRAKFEAFLYEDLPNHLR